MTAHVAHAFDGAAGYDAAALVQAHAAERLAQHIARLPHPPAPRMLEVGCGTGLLSQALIGRIAPGPWLLTDIAPAMLDRCAARIGSRPDIAYAQLDGEHPDVSGPFDLIASSFVFQWFADLPGALTRLRGLLAPGGHIAFATMADGSLAEWDAAHRTTGHDAAMASYPTLDQLRAMGATVNEERFVERHADARAFLASLRAIGAHRPRDARAPVPASVLRRAMAAFDAAGAAVTYHIAYGVIVA
ncbi:malonyl-CoA O-methyltransferase [Sphingomonas laterariae]|uniref:Malonyl-CoA O-methyltransferase n=1 Tax=Edaphosphingomonas laterariae TaxID=861865 RepID=A0A239C6C6_9SPHN|nr:methyltransferase [Sphingomonas laterariae]SNS15479.1 malonyl-CoA O-methyltransferase [Sphingomonas laterariae]